MPKCMHHTSAVPQPFLLLIAANLVLAGFLGLTWSLWPMPAWLAVQQSKAVFFMTLYVSINDITHPKLSVLHLSPTTAIIVVDWCQFGPSWIFGLKLELMACTDLVGATTMFPFEM